MQNWERTNEKKRISSSLLFLLSLSLSRFKIKNKRRKERKRKRKEGRKIQNEENYRKQWGGEKKKKRKNAGRNGMEKGREREREKRTCACHTSPPSMLIRADDPIRKHAHRSRSRGVFVSRARGLNPARLCWYNIHARVIHSLGDSEQSSSPRFTPTHLLKHSSRTKPRRG